MIFNSFQFLVFFVVVFILYYCLPPRFRWVLLLLSSYVFYMSWKTEYVLLLLFSTVITYLGAHLVGRFRKHGKLIVILSSVAVFLALFYFKYIKFFMDTVNHVTTALLSRDINIGFFDVVFPVGISFYTLQNIGYLLDVYRKRIEPARNFGHFALFASYFPQLVAGPIEKTSFLLPQLIAKHEFSYDNMSIGLRWVLIGLFKKVALADTIAIMVDNVYNDIPAFTGLPLIIATVLFAFQIYCDFSGYSDIAVGISKMLGIDLTRNFKSPYLSTSIAEFWRRWHISLSSWFRDNLYIPLGGSRVKVPRHLTNLMITFLLSGMWHGASWNFIIWGAIHGVFLCISALYRKLRKGKGQRAASWWKKLFYGIGVFIVVDIAWVFFRANNVGESFYIIKNMFVGIEFSLEYVKNSLGAVGFTPLILAYVIGLLAILFGIDRINKNDDIAIVIGKRKTVGRWLVYIVLTCIVLLSFMFTAQSQNFIYFQF